MKASVGSTLTAYRYTGQREDPALSRFAQADTIIPAPTTNLPGDGASTNWGEAAYSFRASN